MRLLSRLKLKELKNQMEELLRLYNKTLNLIGSLIKRDSLPCKGPPALMKR